MQPYSSVSPKAQPTLPEAVHRNINILLARLLLPHGHHLLLRREHRRGTFPQDQSIISQARGPVLQALRHQTDAHSSRRQEALQNSIHLRPSSKIIISRRPSNESRNRRSILHTMSGRQTHTGVHSIMMRTILLALAWVSLFAVPTTASPIEMPETKSFNPAVVVRNRLDIRAARWTFNCYSDGQACRGMGNTSGGSESTAGCGPINGAGCTRYSFDGAGVFKLSAYNNRMCSGLPISAVNGGSVTCLEATGGNWAGYTVGKAD